MSNLSIEIKAPELTTALLKLADAFQLISGQVIKEVQNAQLPAAPAVQQPAIQQPVMPPVQPAYQPAQPAQLYASPAPPVNQQPAWPIQQAYAVPPQQQAQAPVPPAQQPAVPTTAAPTYTLEQLSVAATVALVDTGRMGELHALLAKYGIAALTQLPKEQYGNFAMELKAMGAKL